MFENKKKFYIIIKSTELGQANNSSFLKVSQTRSKTYNTEISTHDTRLNIDYRKKLQGFFPGLNF